MDCPLSEGDCAMARTSVVRVEWQASMLLNSQHLDGITIVQLPEKINASNSRAFETDVKPLMDENLRFIFDLTQVKQLDSSGLGAIVGCLKHLRTAGGDLKLCGMSKQIRTIFEIVRMHRVFDIFNNQQEAIQSYQEPDRSLTRAAQ